MHPVFSAEVTPYNLRSEIMEIVERVVSKFDLKSGDAGTRPDGRSIGRIYLHPKAMMTALFAETPVESFVLLALKVSESFGALDFVTELKRELHSCELLTTRILFDHAKTNGTAIAKTPEQLRAELIGAWIRAPLPHVTAIDGHRRGFSLHESGEATLFDERGEQPAAWKVTSESQWSLSIHVEGIAPDGTIFDGDEEIAYDVEEISATRMCVMPFDGELECYVKAVQ